MRHVRSAGLMASMHREDPCTPSGLADPLPFHLIILRAE
jgi:hypothetical protein